MTITHQNQRYIKNILKEYCQKTFEPFLSKKSLIKICNFLVDVCKKRVSCSCCNYGDTMSLQSLTMLTQFPHSQQLFLACVYVVSRHFKGLWHRRRIYLEAKANSRNLFLGENGKINNEIFLKILTDSNQCPSGWLPRMLPLSYTRQFN